MRKNYGFVLLVIMVLCVALCGCNASKVSPWGEKTAQNAANNGPSDTYKIYVCGAVQNEGYFEVAKGDAYFAAIAQAGLLEKSWLSSNFYTIVDGSTSFVVVNYVENGVEHSCLNVNSEFIAQRYPIADLSDGVVNKIADYVEEHGKIANKTVLRSVLGDDFEIYHYKLYIAEADYEKAD